MSSKYSKDSFDRFGDDLCELVLSLVSIEDCFRFESISKQFKRLLFQNKCQLNCDHCLRSGLPLDLKDKAFQSMLKKCPNIKTLKCSDGQLVNHSFDFIVKHCNHLTDIDLNYESLSEERVKEMFNKFGLKLKSIHLYNKSVNNKAILQLCPSLTHLYFKNNNITDLSVICKSDQILVKGLKKIVLSSMYPGVFVDIIDTTYIEMLFKYNNNLEEISLDFCLTDLKRGIWVVSAMNESNWKSFFNELIKLSKLRALKIRLDSLNDISLINDLNQLSINFKNLTKFDLNVYLETEESLPEVFQTLKHCKQLKRFSFQFLYKEYDDYSGDNIDIDLKCKSLKDNNNLIDLQINRELISVGYQYFNERFFEDIGIHLPKLQLIAININEITDKTFIELSKLKHLKHIRIECFIDLEINETIFMQFIESCRKCESIDIQCESMFGTITSIYLNSEDIYKLRKFGLKDSEIQLLTEIELYGESSEDESESTDD